MKGKKTEVNKKERTKLIMGIAMMVFAVAIAGGTYAYYQTVISGTVSGTILAWDCVNGSTTQNINLGNLKPGASGSFTIKGYSTNFKTDITFTINTGSGVPTNLKFYKDASYSNAITLGSAAWTDNNVTKGTTGASHTVYWQWARGTAETGPTTSSSVSLSYSITCKQSSSQ